MSEDKSRPAILIVDDEENVTRSLARSLRDQFQVFTASSAAEALNIIAHEDIAVVLTDQRMPGLTGVELLDQVRNVRPEVVGIIISGYTDIVALVDAINLGTVRGYIPKPWDLADLRRRLDSAVHSYQASFLNREVLHSSAEAVTRMQKEITWLQQALDMVASGESVQSLVTIEAPSQMEPAANTDSPATTKASRSVRSEDSSSSLLREDMPDTFQQIVANYGELIDLALDQRVYKVNHRLAHRLRSLSKWLGQLRAGPRDVVEIHSTVLKKKLDGVTSMREQALIEESRLLLLELMGHLINYYRVNFLAQQDVSTP